MPIVRAREYGLVDLPSGFDRVRTASRLEAAGRRVGLRLFETRGSSLFATGVVGVVDIGNLIVEILPKTIGSGSSSEGAAFLCELLRFLGTAGMPATVPASIADAGGGFLELILDWAVQDAGRNLAAGLPRRYVEVEDVTVSVRGRIELARLASRRPGRGLEVTVRHAPLRTDNIVSRTVRWLIEEIGRRTLSLRTRARCARLERMLGEVASAPPRREALADIVLGPFEERWRPLLLLAATLLAQEEPDPTRAGRLPAIAVLYRLHGLFEAAVGRVLARGLRELALVPGRPRQTLLRSDRGDAVALHPDYRLCRPGNAGIVVVGDAKWKRVVRPDGRVDLREEDVYQLTAYAAGLSAEAAFMVSPLDDAAARLIVRRYEIAGLRRPLVVMGVHLPTLIADAPDGETLRREVCTVVAGLVRRAEEAAT
ncbi:5-methylcytosine restriction system specificity protein McrC [Methylobacterium mesophilicum]|uniref:5-methylcytosine restriction system specificity protein McrC n=1 Tax=Methylobacterium mesophilicum TaxID=39956 RepID=UPI002F35256C